MMRARVLIVEDDRSIRRVLATTLEKEGYRVYESDGAQRGLAEATARRPDVILLDLGLPDFDGLEFLKKLRAWSTTPVIVISALGEERRKVSALDLGADDYLVKPFGRNELLARIRVALRNAARGIDHNGVFEQGGLRVDLASHRVTVRGCGVHLTATEFKLLGELVKAAGRVLTHRQLLVSIWGPSHERDTHYLRLYMAQLRAKLEDDPTNPKIFLTEQGIGYRLAIDE